MKQYSPISKIYIKNFRNIGDATIDFSESPIISLIGENESGKTSIVKAFSVCAMHSNPREQKDYIRDGTDGFGVAIELQDGTLLTRLKYKTANRYQIKYPDNTVWAIDKIDPGVPKQVLDIMGMTEEPETKEYIHIRTYEDLLLFVVTPASTNYKVMYNALKVEQLTKAIKAGSVEVNELKSEINYADNSIRALTGSLNSIKIRDIEPLINIKNKLLEQQDLLIKLESAIRVQSEISSLNKQLGSLVMLDQLESTNIDELSTSKIIETGRLLENISSMGKCLSTYSNIDAIEEIDTTILNKVTELLNKKNILDRLVAESGALSHLNEVYEVSEVVAITLNRAIDLYNNIEQQSNRVSTYEKLDAAESIERDLQRLDTIQSIIAKKQFIDESEKSLGPIDTYIEQMLDWMKRVGVSTASCPKCGETIVIDIEQFNT